MERPDPARHVGMLELPPFLLQITYDSKEIKMNKEYPQGRITYALLVLTALFSISPLVTATTTHLCSDGAVCDIPAITFVSGTGDSAVMLSGNPGTDILIIDSGNTAYVPEQQYANFGVVENHGTFINGDSNFTFPWLRIFGPGAKLDNYGVTNNQSSIYVQNSSVLGSNAPEGSGKIYNRIDSVFNNGTSSTYSSGEYFSGDISLYDDAEIINDGIFNNYSYIYVDETSSFTNNGILNNYAQEMHGTEVLFEGEIINTGTIHNKAGAIMETTVFHNTATGKVISEGKLESYIYDAQFNGAFTNEGEVEITATGTGITPGFYSPGTFTQSAGSLKVDGQFIQSQFDIQGGIVTGGGALDTTNSAVAGANPTVHIGPSSVLMPGNGIDNEMLIIGDVKLEGELIIELGGTSYDFLHIVADTAKNSSNGYLDLAAILTVLLLDDFSANVGDTYDIIRADGGLFNDFTSDVIFDVGDYTFERIMDSNTVSLSVYSKSVSAVPLPTAAFMFAPALLGLIGLRRKAKTTVV